jgi:hypothetical protein
MPSGPITYQSYSASTSGDDAQVAFAVPASATVSGVNVIAVSVHNRDAGSSDLSFDMAVVGTVPPPTHQPTPAPVFAFAAPLPVTYGDVWSYKADGSDQGTAWTGTTFSDVSWSSGPGQLGFGESDQGTTFSLETTATYYFRKRVALAAPSVLNINLLFDDGAVVYVNGVEVGIFPRRFCCARPRRLRRVLSVLCFLIGVSDRYDADWCHCLHNVRSADLIR